MMEQYTFTHKDTDLASYRWLPQDKPRARLFLAHGMTEHAQRYDEFARFLCDHGIAVYAHDHRGHGQTQSPGIRGHFADKDGWNLCVEDIASHIEFIRAEQDPLPFFLFGHSMGSFMAQEYIIRFSNRIAGCILSGSNGKPQFVASLGRYLYRIARLRKGRRGFSRVLDKIGREELMRNFKPLRTQKDWLTRDEAIVDIAVNDPNCNFDTTNQMWIDLLDAYEEIAIPKRQEQIRKDLPLFLFSGSRCSVGLEGKGLRNLLNAYSQAGLYRVQYIIYPGGRHEMLNETNREEVYRDVIQWLDSQLS
ncbi:MAG: alpha/beta hydrolase [Myxococcota bacterium]|nr:alpha/beta hydrolase [Myxococcota bacterium]